MSSGRCESSPRTWGCFYTCRLSRHLEKVFPTHVGVFLGAFTVTSGKCRLPHARGGVSLERSRYARSQVFPTHVGVFPSKRWIRVRKGSLPHARGGVSSGLTLSNTGLRSSPRTWGCFSCASCSFRRKDVFPTHVGVFPVTSMATEWKARLPHARGGVSKFGSYHVRQQGSSPRTWGCFRSGTWGSPERLVFPTHVGVFP